MRRLFQLVLRVNRVFFIIVGGMTFLALVVAILEKMLCPKRYRHVEEDEDADSVRQVDHTKTDGEMLRILMSKVDLLNRRLGIEQRNSTASAVRSSQAKQMEPQVDELPSSSMDKVVPSGFGLSGPRNVSASTIGAEIRNADPVEFKELVNLAPGKDSDLKVKIVDVESEHSGLETVKV
eukprot:TRINITY_DN28522_c0_g1_i1.p1 TRINITY_DN28522_c0_g1~~TRINITY_DN28522_c0_g1_i1.p1  ORF type:complete len:179 (+),score=28.04 TRINITY_DN28522_c0_g1_i1:247-783(+)